jgi:predicted  nucleic acid-binding Zn-ribbon protein
MKQKRHRLFLVLMVLVLTVGCQSVYYSAMETFGRHKRDILVDRVEKARDSQEAAKDQFQSALERFSEVLGYQGGALEDKYNQLKAELDRSEARAQDVRKRIASVEDVAGALFNEWEGELRQYSNQSLRRKSEEQLRATRRRYDQLIDAMHRAESKIEPVLSPLRDQVLFIKHNLNAQAIASLQSELATIETDVASLIRDMEASIAEANEFIEAMSRE